MSRTRLLGLGCLILAFSAPAWAADFSGTYSVQKGTATLAIQHSGDTLNFTHTRTDRQGQQRATSFTYVVDGQNRAAASLKGASRTVTAQWQDANTLVVQSTYPRFATTETWKLDGNTLTLEFAPQPQRPHMKRQLVFQR